MRQPFARPLPVHPEGVVAGRVRDAEQVSGPRDRRAAVERVTRIELA